MDIHHYLFDSGFAHHFCGGWTPLQKWHSISQGPLSQWGTRPLHQPLAAYRLLLAQHWLRGLQSGSA